MDLYNVVKGSPVRMAPVVIQTASGKFRSSSTYTTLLTSCNSGFKEAQCGASCISNCNATAMCGIDSADGATPCGLNLCCSHYGWCGTEEVHCYDPEPKYGKTPCQQGYGACSITPKPSCGKGSGTSGGRRIGYYQV
jgi:hypothetical protein